MDMEEKTMYLTDREKTIIDCIKRGLIEDDEIGECLGISAHTVTCFMQRLYQDFCIDKGQKRARLVYEVMR